MSQHYADIGSGKRALIEIVGCDFKKFDITNSIRSTEEVMTDADWWMNGGADLIGHSNTPFFVHCGIS